MEVINTLLADNTLKAGQWLRPSASLSSKSINENEKENTHISQQMKEKSGWERREAKMNEVEPRWSDCLNFSPKYRILLWHNPL